MNDELVMGEEDAELSDDVLDGLGLDADEGDEEDDFGVPLGDEEDDSEKGWGMD